MHTKLPLIEQLINNSLIWFIRRAWPRVRSPLAGQARPSFCLSVRLDGMGETERQRGKAERPRSEAGNVQGKENNLHPSFHSSPIHHFVPRNKKRRLKIPMAPQRQKSVPASVTACIQAPSFLPSLNSDGRFDCRFTHATLLVACAALA